MTSHAAEKLSFEGVLDEGSAAVLSKYFMCLRTSWLEQHQSALNDKRVIEPDDISYVTACEAFAEEGLQGVIHASRRHVHTSEDIENTRRMIFKEWPLQANQDMAERIYAGHSMASIIDDQDLLQQVKGNIADYADIFRNIFDDMHQSVRDDWSMINGFAAIASNDELFVWSADGGIAQATNQDLSTIKALTPNITQYKACYGYHWLLMRLDVLQNKHESVLNEPDIIAQCKPYIENFLEAAEALWEGDNSFQKDAYRIAIYERAVPSWNMTTTSQLSEGLLCDAQKCNEERSVEKLHNRILFYKYLLDHPDFGALLTDMEGGGEKVIF